MVIHSPWNALSLGISLPALGGLKPAQTGLGAAALLIVLTFVALAAGLGLAGLTPWLRARSTSATPPLSMQEHGPRSVD